MNMNTLNNLMNQAITKAIAVRDSELEDQIRRLASPPIKGKVTKGKLRWRGIKIVIRESDRAVAAFQREQRISSWIKIEATQCNSLFGQTEAVSTIQEVGDRG